MNLTFRPNLAKAVCFALVILMVGATLSSAAIINDLRNTGLDGIGSYIATHGTPDGNYTMLSSPLVYPAVTVNDTVWPIAPNGPWLINNPGSRWIGPDASSNGAGGNYVYRTTFTVPANAILSTVNVSGLWATDDQGIDVVINGISTGQTDFGMSAFAPFTITSGFVFGLNTLDFHVVNANIGTNPTGLRVDRVLGTYRVPEPLSGGLILLGWSLSTLMLRRSRSLARRT